jgi:hypothetical protein
MPYTFGQPDDQSGLILPTFGSDPSWKMVVDNPYDRERAWAAQQPNRRGTLMGGASWSRALDFGNERQWAVVSPKPALTAPLFSDEQAFTRRQLGAIEWDSIDPFSTLTQVADQVKMATGEDYLGPLRSAQEFLASKDVDLMGMGSTGAPVRAMDYALAFPIALFNRMNGQSGRGGAASPLPQDSTYFKFQADPRYWQTIRTATPDQLRGLAVATAAKFTDPATNAYFVSVLEHQFQKDREFELAQSSGDEATDYLAIKATTAGMPGSGTGLYMGFPKVPLFGTQVAEFFDPVTDAERAHWAALAPDVRREALNTWGAQQMIANSVGSLVAAAPALSAFGTMLAVARTGGVVTRSIAEGYDWLLRGTGWLTTAGLTAATTNWALEAAVPGYSEFLGSEIDHSRPISGLQMAGAINAIGYFATGTWGASNLIRGGVRATRLASDANYLVRARAAAARGLEIPSSPGVESTLFSVGHGGVRIHNDLTATGIDPGLLMFSKKKLQMSYLVQFATKAYHDIWAAIVRGEATGRVELDALAPEERMARASADLQHAYETSHADGEMFARIDMASRKPAALFRSADALNVFRWFKEQARTIDHNIARMYLEDYGDAWITRVAGDNSEAAMRKWVEGSVERLGGDPAKLTMKGTVEWSQAMRSTYHAEFDRWVSEVDAALQLPGIDGKLSREVGKLSVVSNRHLFNNDVPEALAALRGEDPALAAATVRRLVTDTIEGERWFSKDWRPAAGEARDLSNVKAEQMARWIEDVQSGLPVRRRHPPESSLEGQPLNQVHSAMVKDGQWDLAFKPVNDAGEAVHWIHTRDGAAFTSPWLDYPLGNADNIELGNRGLLAAKWDAAARGFRTWRIAEFQRGALYRNLTGRFVFMPSQIDAFHAQLLTLSRKYNVQIQTLGTVKTGFAGVGTGYHEAILRAAHESFGVGPYLTRSGEMVPATVIDWQKVAADSYRQSLKLNFTAGLTSHMKSRFGPIGSAAAFMSDIVYLAVRFGLSPVFKVGEVVESKMFSAMIGANPGGDPWVEALMYRAGIGNDFGPLATEMNYDQTLQGLQFGGDHYANNTRAQAQRQAASYVFHARQAPQSMAEKVAEAAMEARNEVYRQYAQGGTSVFASPQHALQTELASLIEDTGYVRPENQARADEIIRILDAPLTEDAIRAAHHVGPELPNDQWSLDPMELRRGSGDIGGPIWVDPSLRPEDRGLWHATEAVDSVHANGLLSVSDMQTQGIDYAVGLGGGHGQVSVTTDYNHATIIAERKKWAILAARNEATTDELLDYFMGIYGLGQEDSFSVLTLREAADRAYRTWGKGTVQGRKALQSATTEAELASAMRRYFGRNADAKYAFVQAADGGLGHGSLDEGFQPYHSVILVGSRAEVARANPAQVGVVQVGIRKGASYFMGSDVFELQLKSSDIWTLDRRILDQPFATDREGLYSQLRSTTRPNGDVIPGLEAYHDGVIAELAKLDAAEKPLGELAPQPFRSAAADYPGFPDAEYVPTKTLADYRELDRETTPRMAADKTTTLKQATIDFKEAARRPYFEAIEQIESGHGVPTKHPVTGADWAYGDPAAFFAKHPTFDFEDFAAEAAHSLRVDAASLIVPTPATYLDNYTTWVEGRIANGELPFTEPVIMEYDPATKTAMVTDGNHRIAVARRLGITELPTRMSVLQHRTRPEFVGAEPPQAQFRKLPDEPIIQPKLDGYIPATVKPSQVFTHRVDQVDNAEDVFGTPEYLTRITRERLPEMLVPGPYDNVDGFAKKVWQEIKNPVPGKERQAKLLEIEKLRRDFPTLLKAAGLDEAADVFRSLGLAERDWLPFLIRDRELATEFHNSGTPEALQALIDHAGPDARKDFEGLYRSEDWQTITGLFALSAKSASDEAFRVHFFNPYRSAIERSLNHPLMGVYPLSWAYKAARIWANFLFENQTISGLRLGMTPAVALSSLVRAQNIAFAQNDPKSLEEYIGTKGPFGSAFMIFNLLLPGDWSTIPFPASRTIRDALRGNLGSRTLENNIGSLGMFRDGRLLLEMGGEAKDFIWGPDQPQSKNGLPPPWAPHPNVAPLAPSTLDSPSFDDYRK